MSTAQETKEPKKSSFGSSSIVGIVVRLTLLGLIDAFAVWFILNLVEDGVLVLAIAVGVITFLVNVVIMRDEAFPIRWMLIGLVLMAMFAVYPILFTIFVAFTNFGDGHLLTEEQAIEQIEKVKYLPEGGNAFTWTAFRSDDGQFALWLQNAEGEGFLALPGEDMVALSPGEEGLGELDNKGVPASIEGYERLNPITAATFREDLEENQVWDRRRSHSNTLAGRSGRSGAKVRL